MTDSSQHSRPPKRPTASVTNIAPMRHKRGMQARLEILGKGLGDEVDIYLNRALTDLQKERWAPMLSEIKEMFLLSLRPLFKADGATLTKETLHQRFVISKAEFAALIKESGPSPMMQEISLLFQNICGQMEAKIAFGDDVQCASAPTTTAKGR